MATPKNDIVIQRTSVNDQLVQYMQNAILEGKWKVGEKIPSEAELADFFQVSKLTVRVALQQLIGLNLLEKRVGDGTYVKKFDFGSYIQRGFRYYMHPALLDQVCDFRLGVELTCCRLAIQTASEAEFEQLRKLGAEFTRMVKTLSTDTENISEEKYDQISDVDFRFHQQICMMSHNELLLHAFDMAKIPIRQYVKTVFKKKIQGRIDRGQEAAAIRDIHLDIFNAMRQRDLAACEEHYIEMIKRDIEL